MRELDEGLPSGADKERGQSLLRALRIRNRTPLENPRESGHVLSERDDG